MHRKSHGPRWTLTFLTCVLAVPTMNCLLYGMPEAVDAATLSPLLAVGALLGVAHLILRPLLRIVTAPLGCLTFGLSGTAIDIALIYLCAQLVNDFPTPSFLFALLTAFFINAISTFVAGRR